MQLYFTTIFRGAPLRKAGELVHLDWKRKEVKARVPIYPDNPAFDDPNPRGGGRGGRGIIEQGENLLVASYHTLHLYNRELEHLKDISHRHFVGIHEVDSYRPDRVWVTSTTIDLALELNLEDGSVTQQFWVRRLPGFQDALGVEPLGVDNSADNRTRYLDTKYVTDPNHLHLNAVAKWQEEMYALFGFHGVIANLNQQAIIVEDPKLKPGHNLFILEDGTAVVLGTYSRTIRFYDLANGKLVRTIDLMQFQWVRDLLRWRDRIYGVKRLIKERILAGGKAARPLFLRGLDIVGRKIFIGATPAIILCIDLDSGELIDQFVYSSNVLLGIHGIKVIDG